MDTVTDQTGLAEAKLLSPALDALVLLGYMAAAALVAAVVPLRRDLR